MAEQSSVVHLWRHGDCLRAQKEDFTLPLADFESLGIRNFRKVKLGVFFGHNLFVKFSFLSCS